ncbi:hypothetical protein [Cellvibrio sp.]
MHLNFIVFILFTFSFHSNAFANDSLIEQQQTSLSEISTFKDISGVRHRVVTLDKPTDSHFFTYTDDSVYVNHVSDKNKNLRLVKFEHEQYNIVPFQKQPNTPLSWTLSDIQKILTRDKDASKNAALNNGKALLVELKRQCGQVRVFAKIDEKERDIRKYFVDFEKIGVMESYDTIEGVTCNDSTVTVGTLSCASERGPCRQQLYSAQYKKEKNMLSEVEILQKIYGPVGEKHKLYSVRYGENKYASVSLTRYIEFLNRQLLYVATTITAQPGDEFICGACERTIIISVFEMKNKTWELVGTSKPYSVHAFANPQIHMQQIADNSVGIVLSYLYGRQGEHTMNHRVYKINAATVDDVLDYGHFYTLKFDCEYPKKPYSNLEFLQVGEDWDIKITSGHYITNDSCKSTVFSKEETIYKYQNGSYQLSDTNADEHIGNY